MFIDEFSHVLNNFESDAKDVVLFGDYNIDLLKMLDKPKVNEFFELMLSRGYIPKITLPTRIQTSATLIDNAFCKISRNFSSSLSRILTSNISDHQAYFVCFDYLHTKKVRNPKFIKIRKQDSLTFNNFLSELQSQQIETKLNHQKDTDPNENYNILEKIITNLYDKHFTERTVRFNKHRHRKNNWITRGVLNSIKFRDKLYVKLKKTPINSQIYHTLKTNLSTYNKILKETIKQAKHQYYHYIFDKYKKDIKNTWKTIKEIMNKNKNSKEMCKKFTIDGKIVSQPQEIANSFNIYFNEIGPSLAAKIVQPPNMNFTEFLNNMQNSSTNFSFQAVTTDAVSKIIDNLPSKTSLGCDGLSVKFLKNIKNVILKPLTTIINQSLHLGLFPEKLKIAKIVPVFKKDDDKLLENYRPISILPAFSKIFEKVMSSQIYRYLMSENILYSSQYGFRESHSTELAALENIDRIVDILEKDRIPINIFLDLSKAFDTLDHELLLYKLSHYGIQGNALNLCRSYLTNRKQYVEYNGYKSEVLTIKTGVPQGSVLGPLFFLIYLNDFDRSTNMFKFITYADDTTLIVSISPQPHTTFPNIQNSLSNELKKVNNWLKINKLSLNARKTKYMMFHNVNKHLPQLNLDINGDQIECVDTFDFLGITIDKNINWKAHTTKIEKKIVRVIAILNRLKLFIPCETLRTIYNSLISPHLLYGILLWGKRNSKVYRLQKKAIRLITKSRYNAHTDPLFKQMNIIKVADMLTVEEWKFYYKLVHRKLPAYSDSISLLRHADRHQYLTRGRNHIVIPKIRYQLSISSIRYRLPHLINQAHNDILNKIQTHSLYGLCFYLKRVFIGAYQTTCTVANCYICQR